MGFTKQLLIVLAVLLALAGLISFVLPPQWEVSREMHINAQPDDVQDVVSDLETWKNWSPWSLSVDSQATLNVSPKHDSVGSWLEWNGPDIGRGKLTVTSSDPAIGLWFDIELRGGRENIKGVMQFSEPANGGCTASFTLRGDVSEDPIGRYVGLMRTYTLGPDLVDSMLRLKRMIERGG